MSRGNRVRRHVVWPTVVLASVGLIGCYSRQGAFHGYGDTRACFRVDISAAGVTTLEGGAATWWSASSVCDAADPDLLAGDVAVQQTLLDEDKPGGGWWDCSYTKQATSSGGYVAYHHGATSLVFGRCLEGGHPISGVWYQSSGYHTVSLPSGTFSSYQAAAEQA